MCKIRRAELLFEKHTVVSLAMNSSMCKTAVNRADNLKIQLPQQMALFTAFTNFTWGNLPLEARLCALQNNQIWVRNQTALVLGASVDVRLSQSVQSGK